LTTWWKTEKTEAVAEFTSTWAPKDGGNTLHGEFFSAYVNHAFVGTNLDLIARGITARPGSDTPAEGVAW
jgi:hypothetical protein